jgi:hypothetical protein
VEDTHHMIFPVQQPACCPPVPFPTRRRAHPGILSGRPHRHTRQFCHPAGGQRSASLDCLFAAFIFHCLRRWRQGPRGDHACASRVGWNARRRTGGGRTAYRWARLCTPCIFVPPLLFYFLLHPNPLSLLTLPYACVVAHSSFPVCGHPGTRYHFS